MFESILIRLFSRLFRKQRFYPSMLVRVGSGQTIYEIEKLSKQVFFCGSSLSKTRSGYRYMAPREKSTARFGPIVADLCQVGKNRRASVPIDRLVKQKCFISDP